MMNLTGRYELDRERSESLYNHMKSLQCDEIAALASEKLHVTIDIVQSEDELHVYQNSQLGDTKRVLFLREETEENESRKATVTLTATTIQIDTVFPRGKLIDKRHFEDNGGIMAQQLELSVTGMAGVIKTKRYFRKLGPPDLSVTQRSPF